MYTLNFKHHFDAAHFLKNYSGPCANLHGHRWVVEIEIVTDTLIDDMVVDFRTLKSIVDKLDHSCLNDKVKFTPTAEHIAKYLSEEIKSLTGFNNKVTIWESPESSITYEN